MLAFVAALLCTSCLSACGASSDARDATSRTGGTSSRPAGTITGPTAARLLARSELALDHVHSFHVQGAQEDLSGAVVSESVDVAIPGRLELSYVSANQRLSLRLVGAFAYVKGNARYWLSEAVPDNRVRALSGRWVQEPAADVPASVRDLASPTMLGRCMLGLSNSKVAVVKKHNVTRGPIFAFEQTADRPSATTAVVAASAKAPWLPFLATQYGPDDPPDSACGETAAAAASVKTISAQFSRYNLPVHINVPVRALSLRAAHVLISTPGLEPAGRAEARQTPEQAQAARMNGIWLATGTVTSSHRFFNTQVGTIVHRIWRIRTSCVKAVCQATIYRTTDPGLLVAGLGWAHGYWTASFDNTSACPYGPTNPISDHMTLWLTGSGLSAVEQDRTGAECGPPATSVMVWTAHQPLRPADSKATT